MRIAHIAACLLSIIPAIALPAAAQETFNATVDEKTLTVNYCQYVTGRGTGYVILDTDQHGVVALNYDAQSVTVEMNGRVNANDELVFGTYYTLDTSNRLSNAHGTRSQWLDSYAIVKAEASRLMRNSGCTEY